jgi:BlaI family transcriptional regulator, penicillinase repressor
MAPKSIDVGPLEMQVLGILDGKPPTAVSEIQTSLKKANNELAYTTVMTVLVRLYNKGYLKRQKEGRQFLYYVTSGKEGTSNKLFEKVRKSLFQNERLKPILALLDGADELSPQELKELRKAVDERLKGIKNEV